MLCQEQGVRTFSFYKREKVELGGQADTYSSCRNESAPLFYRKGSERLSQLLV